MNFEEYIYNQLMPGYTTLLTAEERSAFEQTPRGQEFQKVAQAQIDFFLQNQKSSNAVQTVVQAVQTVAQAGQTVVQAMGRWAWGSSPEALQVFPEASQVSPEALQIWCRTDPADQTIFLDNLLKEKKRLECSHTYGKYAHIIVNRYLAKKVVESNITNLPVEQITELSKVRMKAAIRKDIRTAVLRLIDLDIEFFAITQELKSQQNDNAPNNLLTEIQATTLQQQADLAQQTASDLWLELLELEKGLLRPYIVRIEFDQKEAQKKAQLEQIEREKEDLFNALRARAKKLGDFFPLLQEPGQEGEASLLSQLPGRYFQNGQLIADPEEVEQALLTELFERLLQQQTQGLEFIPGLEAFNKQNAPQLARIAFPFYLNKEQSPDWNQLFTAYSMELRSYIQAQAQAHTQVDAAALLPSAPKEPQQNLSHSLSYVWDNPLGSHVISGHHEPNASVDAVREDMEMMSVVELAQEADHLLQRNEEEFEALLDQAHDFLQATGFSMHKESPFFVIRDSYNNKDFFAPLPANQVSIARKLSTLRPLMEEYKHALFYDKGLNILSRSLAPLLIIFTPVVLTAVALGPLSWPAMAILVALIPAFVVGFALANQYVIMKNEQANKKKAQQYPSHFDIPEFQINEKMREAFGENAEKVKGFYVRQLKKYKALFSSYGEKYEIGQLNQEEVQDIKQAYSLLLEWYDIHSNANLRSDQRQEILSHRLQKTKEEIVKGLQQVLKAVLGNGEEDFIRNDVAEKVRNNLKDLFSPQSPADKPDQKEELVEYKDEGAPEGGLVRQRRVGLFSGLWAEEDYSEKSLELERLEELQTSLRF